MVLYSAISDVQRADMPVNNGGNEEAIAYSNAAITGDSVLEYG